VSTRARTGHATAGGGGVRWADHLDGPRPAAALGALAAVAALSATPGAVREWLATHWLFTYREGLGRRAVVGSVLDAARGGSPPSLALITVLSLVALAGLAALLVALAVRALRADPRPGTLLVVAWLFASPATLRFVAQDLGRFDTINLAIVVGVLLLLPRCSRAVALALVAVACATGVAVHEAFLVLHVPLLLVVTAVVVAPVGGDTGRTTFGVERRTWVAVAATGFPAVATYLWVQLGAGIDAAAVPGVLAELRARTDFHVSEDSLLVQARGLGEVQAYTTGGLAGAGPAQVAALFATILVACLPVLVIVGRRLWRSSGERVPAALRDGRLGRSGRLGPPQLLLVAGLSPLLLQPLAIDWGRWWALAAMNVTLAALWWAAHGAGGDPPTPDASIGRDPVGRGSWLVVAVWALVPAIGDTGGFRPVGPVRSVLDLVDAFRTVLGG
jgi:hypothetical protein